MNRKLAQSMTLHPSNDNDNGMPKVAEMARHLARQVARAWEPK